MAVLVEAISVIVRRDAIERAYKRGWAGFCDDVPNATLCADADLARVGFMDPESVERFVDKLSARGMSFVEEGKCVDIAVVDQRQGPTAPCDWLEFGHLSLGEHGVQVSACWLFEGPRFGSGLHMNGLRLDLATPPGWRFKGSLSESFSFVPESQTGQRLQFVRTENGLDVFADKETGKEVFIPTRSTD